MRRIHLSKETLCLLLPAALLFACSVWLQSVLLASRAAYGGGVDRPALSLPLHAGAAALALALALAIGRFGLHRPFLRFWYLFPAGLAVMLMAEAPFFQPSRSRTFLVFQWWHGAPAMALAVIATVALLAFALPRLRLRSQCGMLACVALLALSLPVWLRPETDDCRSRAALNLIREGGWLGAKPYMLLSVLPCDWGRTFSHLCGAGGLLAALAVLALTALLLAAAWRIAWLQRDACHRALAACCAFVLTVQPLLHLCVNIGLYPMRLGIHYPFLGSDPYLLLLDSLLLGLLLALERSRVIDEASFCSGGNGLRRLS
jgi:cell division protein FtsW (lipid II flippase)